MSKWANIWNKTCDQIKNIISEVFDNIQRAAKWENYVRGDVDFERGGGEGAKAKMRCYRT